MTKSGLYTDYVINNKCEMARILRYLLLLMAGMVLTALFQPSFENMFAAMGLHAQPEPMDDPLGNWLTAIVGKTAFPWITGGLVGVALGAWLHHAMSFLDRKRQGKDQLFGQLHSDLETAEKGWLDSLRDEEGEYDFSKKHHLKKLELEALYRELRLLGITTPVYEDLPPIEFNVGHYSYLQEMRVLSYRNQLQDAKNRSKEIEREFRAVIEQQQEQQIEA